LAWAAFSASCAATARIAPRTHGARSGRGGPAGPPARRPHTRCTASSAHLLSCRLLGRFQAQGLQTQLRPELVGLLDAHHHLLARHVDSRTLTGQGAAPQAGLWRAFDLRRPGSARLPVA
jgi:hypothetical protein